MIILIIFIILFLLFITSFIMFIIPLLSIWSVGSLLTLLFYFLIRLLIITSIYYVSICINKTIYLFLLTFLHISYLSFHYFFPTMSRTVLFEFRPVIQHLKNRYLLEADYLFCLLYFIWFVYCWRLRFSPIFPDFRFSFQGYLILHRYFVNEYFNFLHYLNYFLIPRQFVTVHINYNVDIGYFIIIYI
jgi:hypothetical protein